MLSVNFSKSLLTSLLQTRARPSNPKSGILNKSLTIRGNKFQNRCLSSQTTFSWRHQSLFTKSIGLATRRSGRPGRVSMDDLSICNLKTTTFTDCGTLNEIKKLVHLSRQSGLEYQGQGVNYPRHGCAGHRLVLGSQFR